MAYCRLRQGGRWFRLDRIQEAALTNEPAPARDLDALFGDAPLDAHPVRVTAPPGGDAEPRAR